VLEQPSVYPEDNFFDLGGGLALADVLFAEIAERCGRELPSSTICHAPTVAELAALLEQPTLPRFSPFVQLRPGCEQPPIFIVHGLAGTAQFFKLARYIYTPHPIYGIEAKGVNGLENPFDRVEDMAGLYVDALRELRIPGPCILIGYSFGGLIALEMAQRMWQSNEPAPWVVMIDAYPHPRFLSPSQRLKLTIQRTKRHFSEMKRLPLPEAMSYFTRGLQHRLHVGRGHGKEVPASASCFSFARTTENVKEKAYVALGRYRPSAYHGKITFIRGESNYYFPSDPVAVWGDLVDELEVRSTEGGHLDMVTTRFESLAQVLTDYLSGVSLEMTRQLREEIELRPKYTMAGSRLACHPAQPPKFPRSLRR
jgi:acetoacetyl-CoA synthetase